MLRSTLTSKAVFLRDVTYIFDGNAKFNDDGSVNFDRMVLLYRQIRLLRRFQDEVPNMTLSAPLLEYIQNINGITDEEVLYNMSLQRQPLAATSPRLSSPRRLQLSELLREPLMCNAFRKYLEKSSNPLLSLRDDLYKLSEERNSALQKETYVPTHCIR